MRFRGVSILAVLAALFSISQFVMAKDEVAPSDLSPTGSEAISKAKATIRADYDKKPYEELFEYPRCVDVMDRKNRENMDILQMVLRAQDPEYRDLFNEMEHQYPSRAILEKARSLTTVPPQGALPAAAKAGEKPAPAQRKVALFFDGETEIYHLIPTAEGNAKAKTVRLSEVKEGELVLSTTSLMIADPRYHKDCWATVGKVFSSPVAKAEKMGLILFRSAQKEKMKIKATLSPCLYCRTSPDAPFKQEECTSPALVPNSELYTLNGKKNGYCRFSEVLEETADQEFVAFNLGIVETGAYYIGRLGSEILIHN